MKKKFLFLYYLSVLVLPTSLFANDFIKQINNLYKESVDTAPDLKIARSYKSQKNADNLGGLAHLTPQAFFTMKQDTDILNNTNPVLKTLGVVPPDHSWSINYNWSLFNYGLIQSTIKTREESIKSGLELTNKEQEYGVTFYSNLLNFLLAKYKTLAVINSLKKSETAKREATLGFELGQKTKIDVLRAEANFISLTSKNTKFLDEVEEAKNTFLESSGLESEAINFLLPLSEEEIIDLINKMTQSNPVNNSLTNIENTPLSNIISADEKINMRALNLITKDEWPELKLQGSYNNAGNSYSESFKNPTRAHSISIILTVPIWGGGSLISSNFAQYFSKKQLEYSLTRDKLRLKNKFEISFQKIKTLETLITSLTVNVAQFEELFKLTSKSYQLGKSTFFELLDVQDNLLDSKISLAENKIQLYTLTKTYLWQTGSP